MNMGYQNSWDLVWGCWLPRWSTDTTEPYWNQEK